jgi:hypothetical protein
MMKFDYCGERVDTWLPICIVEGWRDYVRNPFEDSLYRKPLWRHIGWKIGNVAARVYEARP